MENTVYSKIFSLIFINKENIGLEEIAARVGVSLDTLKRNIKKCIIIMEFIHTHAGDYTKDI